MPPAARITDMHVCPMATPGTPPIPHVGGPVVIGSPTVITAFMPQARVGDMCVCVGPPDTIAKGSTGVFVNAMPAARIGDLTAHGGSIVAGCPTVIIGEKWAGGGGGAGASGGGVPAAVTAQGTVSIEFTEYMAQVQVLVDAAKAGTPFCEPCFKNIPHPSTAKAPSHAKPAPAPVIPPPPAPPTPARAPGAKVCELVASTITCSHGRQAGPERRLMVVPTSTAAAGDTISCVLSMKGGCGEHPSWNVAAAGKSGKTTSFSFNATTWVASSTSPLTLQGVSPTSYSIVAGSCQGGAGTTEVLAYPPGSVSFKLNATAMIEKVAAVLLKLPIAPEKIQKWKKQFFQGSATYTGGWKEDKPSWKAYYDKTWELAFDPLASISHKGPVYPLTLVPGWLARWVKAGVFYEIGLSSSVSGTIAGAWWPSDGQNRWKTREVSGGGSGKAALSLEMKFVSEDLVEGSIVGDTGLGVKATLGVGDEPTLELEWGFLGIAGTFTAKAIFGVVEFTRRFDLVGPVTSKTSWPLGK